MNIININNLTSLNWLNAYGANFESALSTCHSFLAQDNKKKKSLISSGNKVILIANANLNDVPNRTISENASMFKKRGIVVAFLRNALSPSGMFNTDSQANELGGNNIIFVPDYSILSFKTPIGGKEMNFLFIGGQITPERSWKMKRPSSKRHTYYDDESPIYDKDILDEILQSDTRITGVFANYAPSYIEDPSSSASVTKWSATDETLNDDIHRLSSWFDDVSAKLRYNKKQPLLWIYPSIYGDANKDLPGMVYVSADMRSIDLITLINQAESRKLSKVPSRHTSIMDALNREEISNEIAIPGHALRHAYHVRGMDDMPRAFVNANPFDGIYRADDDDEIATIGEGNVEEEREADMPWDGTENATVGIGAPVDRIGVAATQTNEGPGGIGTYADASVAMHETDITYHQIANHTVEAAPYMNMTFDTSTLTSVFRR